MRHSKHVEAAAKVRGAYRRAGWKLSEIGSRAGIDALTYNPVIFEFFHSTATADAPFVIDAMCRTFPAARSWVDVGAGTGAFAAEARRQGLAVQACEQGRNGRRRAQSQGVDSQPFDLARTPPADLFTPVDLAYCFEVAEHVPAGLASTLVAFLSSLAPIVVFTAAPPGQGGIGHINEQPLAYWKQHFAATGKRVDESRTEELASAFARAPSAWFAANVLVFTD
jgi:hypothetical protein